MNILDLTKQVSEEALLGVVVPKQKCAVKVVATGEHCPETGIHQIDGSEDYLCDRCYENWLHIKQGGRQ